MGRRKRRELRQERVLLDKEALDKDLLKQAEDRLRLANLMRGLEWELEMIKARVPRKGDT